jgi:hypothetical protein
MTIAWVHKYKHEQRAIARRKLARELVNLRKEQLVAIQLLADRIVQVVTEDGKMPLDDARVRRRIVEVMLEDL